MNNSTRVGKPVLAVEGEQVQVGKRIVALLITNQNERVSRQAQVYQPRW